MRIKTYSYGNKKRAQVALTFDDGPNPFWTLKILETLKEFDVKANFFLVGQRAEEWPNIVKQIFSGGHLVGNHGYFHLKRGNIGFEEAETVIYSILGQHTKFIRPPYNKVRLCRNYLPALEGQVKIINNNVIPRDWKNKEGKILKIIQRKTKPGAIILLHDGSENNEELEDRPGELFKALSKILNFLKEKNFQLVRLDEEGFIFD